MCSGYACGLWVGCWGLRDGRMRPLPRGIFSLEGQKDKSTDDCAAVEGGTRCPKAQKRGSARLILPEGREPSVLPGRSRVTEPLFVVPKPPVTTQARMGQTVQTDKGSSTSPQTSSGQANVLKALQMPWKTEANVRRQTRPSHSGNQRADHSLLFSQGLASFCHCLH